MRLLARPGDGNGVANVVFVGEGAVPNGEAGGEEGGEGDMGWALLLEKGLG